MSGINIRDLIFAVCRLGNFMIYVSTPEDALDHWDAREFERTKTSYDNLRSEIYQPGKTSYNAIISNGLTKAGNYYYTIPLVRRENHTVKHALEIVPINEDTKQVYVYEDIFNRIFVECNDTITSYFVVVIPKNTLTMNLAPSEDNIELFDNMCNVLILGVLKLLSNSTKIIDGQLDLYKLHKILYKVFAKKMMNGADIITFEDSEYPEECEKLYNAFNTFDPKHKFQTPTDHDVNNMISVLTSII